MQNEYSKTVLLKKSNNERGLIRPATSNDDMDSLARLYILGGERLLPLLYGKKFENIFREAVETPYILKSTYVFEIDKKIVGLISTYPSDYKKKVNPKEFYKILKKQLKFFEYISFLRIVKKIKKQIKEPPDSYHVAILAVFEEYRRKGIGLELLTFAEEIDKKEKYGLIFAEIQSDNIASIKTCEKIGYSQEFDVPL